MGATRPPRWMELATVCIVGSCAFDALAQFIPFRDLPGASKVRSASRAFDGVESAGLIGSIRWDEENGCLYFEKDGGWTRVSIESGAQTAVQPGDIPDQKQSARQDNRRRRSNGGDPGRGRQRTRESSPDGKWTIGTDGSNVTLTETGGATIALTTDGKDGLRYGTASWVYGEELDQKSAMWWSPDSKQVAFYRFDERNVPQYFMVRGYTTLRTRIESECYPKAGDPNPIALPRIRDIASGKDLDIDLGADSYIYGIEFTDDSRELLVHRLNRHQDHLELLAVDVTTGTIRVVVEETQPCFLKHLPKMQFLEDGRRFLWETERSGSAQLELRSLDPMMPIALTATADNVPVANIVEVNETRGDLFFTAYSSATMINPQLYRVRLDGTERERITPDDLHYSRFRISPSGRAVVAIDQTISTPPSTRLYSAVGPPRAAMATLAQGETDPFESRGFPRSQLLHMKAADGTTTMYGKLFLPAQFDPKGETPLVVLVYGGPTSRSVENTFDPVNGMTELGFAIAQIDNRGTSGRGKAFEDATYLKLGLVDLDDQAAGVRQIDALPGIDGTRVGIAGSSYGGYLSVLALLRYPDVFHAGVAESAVTDWRNYDTIYTERYMRTPAENPEGYDQGSCTKLAGALEGDLLLLHGMNDDNVHPSNCFQLVHELQGLARPFEMMIFPTAGHGVAGPSVDSVTWSFLVKSLQGKDQP
ncbi:MAG: DPP IV N-terminal domain-containing protein [Planctomycetota bacterium]|nr:DPP IV N-terminal domain-containing protein [Planctomycetota bacterium]